MFKTSLHSCLRGTRRGLLSRRTTDTLLGSKCEKSVSSNALAKCLTGISHDVAPKPSFTETFDRVYALAEGRSLSSPVNPQEIALVFIFLAQGTMFNIELPHYDSSMEDWLHLSELALVTGDFLSNNMVQGLQTLVSRTIADAELLLKKYST